MSSTVLPAGKNSGIVCSKVFQKIYKYLAILTLPVTIYLTLDKLQTYDSRKLSINYDISKVLFGFIALMTGLIGTILGTIAGMKKADLGWIGAILGLIALYMGASQSTHNFW